MKTPQELAKAEKEWECRLARSFEPAKVERERGLLSALEHSISEHQDCGRIHSDAGGYFVIDSPLLFPDSFKNEDLLLIQDYLRQKLWICSYTPEQTRREIREIPYRYVRHFFQVKPAK